MDDSCVEEYATKCGLRIVADAAKVHRTETARQFSCGQPILSIPPLYALPVCAAEASLGASEEEEKARPVNGDSRCEFCFHTLPARHPRCSQCHLAQYCSTRCLSAHWTVRHHFECTTASATDAMAAKVKPAHRPSLRMAAGVHAVLAATQRRPRWLRIQAAAWNQLVSHRSDHPPHVLRQYAQIASVLSATAGTQEDETVGALCRFGCNNFAAYDYSAHTATGHLCSPLVSVLFNHSCFPNASFVYKDGRQAVHALGGIDVGEEVTLAYVDGMHPRSVRRKTLADVFFFACTCTRCMGVSARGRIDSLLDRPAPDAMPTNLPTDYATHRPSVDPWVMAIVRMLSRLPSGSYKLADQTILDAVHAELPHNVSFDAYRHWLECQDECLEGVSDNPQLWPWASVSSLYVLAFYAMAYPPFHPLVGTQCLEAAKIAWNSMQVSESPDVDEQLVRGLALAAQAILEASADPDASPSSGAMSLTKQIALLLDQVATF
ncbi:hypothetical protein GGI22_005092 [Coemansia erecta]|nr:hypothetical protein GGI22_005092 [Coemansia erecta]